jgi:epoxyqueuosine reductase
VASTSDADLTKDLRDFALGPLDADLIGIAPVERLGGGPEGGRPNDYLPAATSVVVLAAKTPDGVFDVAGRYDEEGKTLGPYMWYGYVVPNWDLSTAASRLARFLEKRGHAALPFPPTGLLYKFGTRADFSHRHAAVAAGLGEFGLSGLLLTPEFGARQRLVSIITDAPLEPSPMYSGPALCRPDVCGRTCIRVCPTRALKGKVSVEIGERTFDYTPVDHVRCKWQYPEKGFRRTEVPIPPGATEEDFREVMRTTKPHPFDDALSQHAFVPQCGACVFRCPSPRFEETEG